MTYIESLEKRNLDPLDEFSKSQQAGVLSIALQFHFGKPTPSDGIYTVLLISPTRDAKTIEELNAFAHTMPEAVTALGEEYRSRKSNDVIWIPMLYYLVEAAQIEVKSTLTTAKSLPTHIQNEIHHALPGDKHLVIPHHIEVRVYPRPTLAQAIAREEVKSVRDRKNSGYSVSTFDEEKPREDISGYDWNEWRYFDRYFPSAWMNAK